MTLGYPPFRDKWDPLKTKTFGRKTMNTLTQTFTETMTRSAECLTDMTTDVVLIAGASVEAATQTTSLALRATRITLDTYNYGVKQTLLHAPKSGEEVVDMFSALLPSEPVVNPAFVGPVQP